MTQEEPVISPTSDGLMSDSEKQVMCEIRFDCLVRMFDYGCREIKPVMPFMPTKSLPPQWFKLQQKFTLDSIKYLSEYELGALIKKSYRQLESAIDDYTNKLK